LTDVSEQPIRPIFKDQEIQRVDLLTLEDGTEMLSRNFSKNTTSLCCVISQKSADIICLAAEAMGCRVRDLTLLGSGDFLFPIPLLSSHVAHPASSAMLESGFDHPTRSGTERKNEWSYASPSPLFLLSHVIR